MRPQQMTEKRRWVYNKQLRRFAHKHDQICGLISTHFQTLVTLENGKLVQKQSWDGKTTILEREIKDGKLIAVS